MAFVGEFFVILCMEKPILFLFTPTKPFVRPYFKKFFENWEISADIANGSPAAAVMVSSTDIYEAVEGFGYDEDSRLSTGCILAEYEKEFINLCAQVGIGGIILRCANIIGTGMNGFPMDLAEEIYRGRFFHFPDNEARISAVHASDIPRAAMAVIAKRNTHLQIFNLTDGQDPTIHDLAEAIAFRMGNKRISNLSTGPQRWLGRLLYGKKYRLYTSSLTFDSRSIQSATDFRPTPVVKYMRTHIYDHESL